MFNSEQAQKKWSALLDHADCEPIKDNYRRAVTATLGKPRKSNAGRTRTAVFPA